MELQNPQACYNQARAPKPFFPKSDDNYVVGTIWGNVRKEGALGENKNFCLPPRLIISLFL